MLANARARAGLTHGTCHELRHTCFTRLREGGMAIEALQAHAGHRSIASTRIYLHLGTGWLAGEYKHAAEAIEAQAAVGAARLARPRSRAIT
jgi:integrase